MGRRNWSGGNSVDQQCGSMAQGRRRPAARFNTRNRAIPVAAAIPDWATAHRPSVPPKIRIAAPNAYHSHPSPPRVAQIIHSRIHLGRRPLVYAVHDRVIAPLDGIKENLGYACHCPNSSLAGACQCAVTNAPILVEFCLDCDEEVPR